MILAINKLLPELLMPLTVAVVLFLIAGIYRKFRWQTVIFWTALALVYLAANPVVMWVTITFSELHEEWTHTPPEHVEDVVVPGGILAWQPGGKLDYSAMSGIDRLLYGIKWAEAESGRRLYLAGGAQPDSDQPPESALMKSFIQDFFRFDTDRVEIDTTSTNTIEHARVLAEKREAEDQQIILVTSARNMKRSIRTFEAHGFEVYPYATDYTPRGSFFRFPGSLIPSAAALNYNSGALRELMGRMYYSLRGYGS